MIKLKDIKNQKINEIKLAEILFYTFPLSFIIGNFLLSLHLLLFIVTSLLLIKKEQLTIRLNNSYWILIFFFLYFFLSTTIQFQNPGLLNEKIQDWTLENQPIFKSFMLFRFIILIIIIDILFLNKILNLQKLFLFSLVCTSFVSFDVILQYITGFDLFGLKSHGTHNTGPFGNEIIAGGYLQKFSFFSFFYIFKNFQNKNYSASLSIFIIVFHFIAILLAGNRMPMILSLFGCFLIILFIKNLRLVMSLSLLIFISIFFLLAKNDTKLKVAYKSFVNEINIFNLVEFNKNINKKKDIVVTEVNKEGKKTKWSEGIFKKNWEGIIILDNSGYNRIYRTAIAIWKEQPLFGFGLKSFRIKCWEVGPKNAHLQPESGISIFSCSNHPHNYYFELLSESGIIGTGLMVIFFLVLLKKSFYYLKKYNQRINSEIILLIPIILVLFIEIWPIRSSGSFFTTSSATFFWLNVGILFATKKNKSL
jgi:hypothetical protein